MQITKVSVKGFKSLADFEMELSPFTCLIGLNGCGKSTVLQFFDFIAHMLAGDVEKWFEAREWEPAEVGTAGAGEIEFGLHFSDGSTWVGAYDVVSRRCTRENIEAGSETVKFDGGSATLRLANSDGELESGIIVTERFAYTGSITNIVRDEALPEPIRALKQNLQLLRTFDTLSPQYLRRRDKQTRDSIGYRGEHLASYIDAMPTKTREKLLQELIGLYPHLDGLIVQNLQGGWKELVLSEAYKFLPRLVTPSKHINDGFLRLLAILAELRSQHSFLLFDEIENGINPELVEALLQKLTTSPHQVLVTTHSPMILNYLEDYLARASVVFLYKGPDAATRSKRFFDIPSIGEKLDVMGPGEAFVDTNLVALTEELNAAVTGA